MRGQVLFRVAGSVAVLAAMSKVLGFLKETSLAAVFGATYQVDAYLVALTLPSLLFEAVSYALTTSFIPVYTQVSQQRGHAAALSTANSVLNLMVLIAAALTALGVLFPYQLLGVVAPGFEGPLRDLTASLIRILLPIMILRAVTGIQTGILEAHGNFSAPAIADLVLTGVIIMSVVVFGKVWGITAVAAGTVIATLIAALLRMPPTRAIGLRWRPYIDFRNPALRQLAILMLPALIGAGAGQLNIMVDRMLASGLAEGRIAALNYANRLMLLAPGVIGTAITTVLFPTLTQLSLAAKWEDFSRSVADTIVILSSVLTPIGVGLAVLGYPVVQLVFERGTFDSAATATTAWVLLFLAPGIPVFALRDFVSRALFSRQDTRSPMLLGLVTVALNVLLNLLLIGPMQEAGLALATTLANTIGLALMLWSLHGRTPTGLPLARLFVSGAKIVAASLAMGGLVWWVYPLVTSVLPEPGPILSIARLAVTAVAGGTSYLLLGLALGIPEFQLLRSLPNGFFSAYRGRITPPGRL